MCIHVHSDLLKEISFWYDEGVTNVSGVQMYDRRDRFVGSWVCFFDQPQSIAQAVHALRTWHPGHKVSLALVNTMRREHGLERLRVEDLPPPQPLAFEGIADNDSSEMVRAQVTKWLHQARAASYARA